MRFYDMLSYFYLVIALIMTISLAWSNNLTNEYKVIGFLLVLVFILMSYIYESKDDIEQIKERLMMD